MIFQSGVVKNIITVIFEYVLHVTDVSGRVRSAEFMKLPTREELPDYYDVIEEPMDLNTIAPRVAASEYATFDDFSADMDKVFNNAMTFNDPGSLVCL